MWWRDLVSIRGTSPAISVTAWNLSPLLVVAPGRTQVNPSYMTLTQQPPAGPRRGYHHGNQREALIQAAQDLIGAKGPAGFTVAEATRLAGVSPAAPYHAIFATPSRCSPRSRRAVSTLFGIGLPPPLPVIPPTRPALLKPSAVPISALLARNRRSTPP